MSEATPTPTPATAPAPTLQATAQEKRQFAAELRKQTMASRLLRERLYPRKALSREQVGTVAKAFNAESRALSAAKKIIDTRDPAYLAVTGIFAKAYALWKSNTTPYPEPGIRLISKAKVDYFDTEMEKLKADLKKAAADLQAKYQELKLRAATDLGELFNASDYPDRIDGEFVLEWDFPNIEPPTYLKDLHPKIYEEQQKIIQARFEEAARLTEQALAEQLQKLVSHLVDRLKGGEDGKAKVFRDSAVENLTEFFGAFKAVGVGQGALQDIVTQAQEIVKNVNAAELRANDDLRNTVAAQLGEVAKAMDGMMLAKGTRKISLTDDED